MRLQASTRLGSSLLVQIFKDLIDMPNRRFVSRSSSALGRLLERLRLGVAELRQRQIEIAREDAERRARWASKRKRPWWRWLLGPYA
jgi:hypothetical protein